MEKDEDEEWERQIEYGIVTDKRLFAILSVYHLVPNYIGQRCYKANQYWLSHTTKAYKQAVYSSSWWFDLPWSSIYQLERVRDKPTKLRNHSQMMLHVLVLSAQISANSTVQRCNVTSVSGSHAVYSVKVFFLGRHISFKHIITIFNIYRL